MPDDSKLLALEAELSERLVEFERLDIAWPKGRGAVERARIGREHENTLERIAEIETFIAQCRPTTVADAAVLLSVRPKSY